jgi:hypothetical protein
MRMKVEEQLRRMTGQEVKVAISKTVFVNIDFVYYHLNAGQCIHDRNCRQDFCKYWINTGRRTAGTTSRRSEQTYILSVPDEEPVLYVLMLPERY